MSSVDRSAAFVPHEGLVVTPFREWRGTYDYEKTQAFVKHLRMLIELVARAQSVRICPLAPERPWVSLQEWETLSGAREGQWASDLEVVKLR